MKTVGGAWLWNSIDSLKKDIAKLDKQIAALTRKKSDKEATLANKRGMPGGKSAKRSKRNNNTTRRR